MGFGFSCVQKTKTVETSKICGTSKCDDVIPPPPPRRKRAIPPPPPRFIRDNKNIKQQRKLKKRYPNKFKCNTNLNIPSNTNTKHRHKSMSNSHSLTPSYISALSPAVSVISALSQAPPRAPFSITNTSNPSHHSEADESDSSSESSVSLVTADHDTTASSLHSIDDGYSLISQHISKQSINTSKPINMMQYVIQIEMEKNYNTNKNKGNATSCSSLLSEDDTESESDNDCHECHETDHEVLSSHLTSNGSPNYITSNCSVLSTVSALSHYSTKGDIFLNHLSVTSQLSELSELSAAKVDDIAVTPRDLSKRYYGRVIPIKDIQIYDDKVGDITKYLETQCFDGFDEGNNVEYVD